MPQKTDEYSAQRIDLDFTVDVTLFVMKRV
jgi:hypothetical protein